MSVLIVKRRSTTLASPNLYTSDSGVPGPSSLQSHQSCSQVARRARCFLPWSRSDRPSTELPDSHNC